MENLLLKMSPKELQDKFGAKISQGKITRRCGKYYFSYEGKKVQIERDKFLSVGHLSDAIGKEANIVFDKNGKIVVVIVRDPAALAHCYYIICYYPVDIRFIHEIETNTRVDLVNRLIADKSLTQELGEQIIAGIKAQ